MVEMVFLFSQRLVEVSEDFVVGCHPGALVGTSTPGVGEFGCGVFLEWWGLEL